MHGISWALVQRMLIDAPRIATEGEEQTLHVEADTPEDFVNAINSMIN